MKLEIMLMLFFIGCGSLNPLKKENREYTFEEVRSIKVGQDSTKNILHKFGEPNEKLEIEEKNLGYKNGTQWTFDESDHSRFSTLIIEDVVQSISWEVKKNEPEEKIEFLLSKINRSWVVVPEPVINPHTMPMMCSLVDKKSGMRIEIHGYKKVVESFTRWNPKLKVKEVEKNNKKPVFCLAGHCSSVSEPPEWKNNHCKFLEKLIK